MAENEAGVAEAIQDPASEIEEAEAYSYPVTITEVGAVARKITVEIPRERITQKLDDQYKDLRKSAAIPGFRIGHAPRKLLEKRFSDDVKNQVAGDLVRESYQQVIKTNKLNVIGEPEFENEAAVKLPEEGSLNYTFSVEVQPDITLPDMAALKVKKPKITITDANVDQAMQNLREQQGALVPVEDRGVQTGDYLLADVHLKSAGEIVGHQHDAQMVARGGRIAGIQIDDLDAKLSGLKPSEKRSINATAPDTFANEALRGKEVEIEVALKDIKRLELAEINEAFLEDLGFGTQEELREALREQMDEKINYDIQQAMRAQVNRYLLDNTNVSIPEKMSKKQTDRVVNRRALDLHERGMSREQIQANVQALLAGAADEAARELKLFFILQKIADDKAIDVSEGELNGRVAMLAIQRDQRPEKLKSEMQSDGRLADLYVQLREQKAIDEILKTADIEEVEMTQKEGEAAAAPASSANASEVEAPQT